MPEALAPPGGSAEPWHFQSRTRPGRTSSAGVPAHGEMPSCWCVARRVPLPRDRRPLYFPVFRQDLDSEQATMPTDFKPGTPLTVTISKTINRDAARKTIERLFMTD